MKPTHAMWLYLNERMTGADIAGLSEWCERRGVRKLFVHLKQKGPYPEWQTERLERLFDVCEAAGIEAHALVSALQQHASGREELWFGDRDCYCVDAHGISSYDEPIAGRGYLLDPGKDEVVRGVAANCADLLRRFPRLRGIHLDFIRYYHYDSRLVIDAKSAGHWIVKPKPGDPIQLGLADGSATTYFVESVRNVHNDPPIGDELVLKRSFRYCFCGSCVAGFERFGGIPVPEELKGKTEETAGWLLEHRRAEWADYRASMITRTVAAVREAVREADPGAKLSATVWYNAPYGNELRGEPLTPGSDYDCFGQHWPTWAERGLVDFLCPMDYWLGPDSFGEVVADQVRRTRGRLPIYAGVLHQPSEFELTEESFAEYEARALKAGAAGLCFFHYGTWSRLLD